MVGDDIEQARRRMRYAWIAGFLWTGLSFVGALREILLPATEGSEGLGLGLGLFVFLIVEVGVVGFLSYGVLQRQAKAATLLFFYFSISRIFWVGVGQISFDDWQSVVRFFAVQVLPAYLFFQGMRGAWTFHYLTRPQVPAAGMGPQKAMTASESPGDQVEY